MAHDSQLPCDGDGVCMRCHTKPLAEQILNCGTCGSGWHVTCLTSKPESLASALNWQCPDCSGGDDIGSHGGGGGGSETELVAAIRRIEADETLTEAEKAKKRQLLLNGKVDVGVDDGGDRDGGDDLLDVLDESFKCSFCMLLPERPVTTPCGHNFCLKCFQKWVGQGKRTCAKCRSAIPPKMASQPRINSTLVSAIRTAKLSKSSSSGGPGKVYHFVRNENRPEKAYTTERAQRRGKSNASSGRIFVTVPPDHFGPILAENDPTRNRGVLVGDFWEDRLECRQWGAHLPHVSGIAGQAKHGAQSVALSGGYIDDEDHGEWFLYTGSGGRDLSGNKRTNKDQSFDQTFENYNEALRLSCKKGYPVRVVRSHKEKRSSYAPETGVRYDGVYRIEKCWRKVGQQGFKVCRYLFVRCDNEPAPWTSDEHGDRPRPLPEVPELKEAMNLTERKESPFWDFNEKDGKWKWIKSPPLSRKQGNTDKGERRTSRSGKKISVKERLLQEFSCRICWKVLVSPVTTPCAHNFCKSCLEGAFAGKSLLRDRNKGGRSLRTQKNIMACPSCPTDIAEFLQDLKVNSELMAVIESLQSKTEENNDSAEDTDEDEPDPGNTESPPSRSEDTDAQNEHEEPPIESKPKKAGRKRKAEPGDMSEIPEAKKPATNTDNSQHEIQPVKSTATPEAEVNASDSPSSPLSMRSPDDVE